MMEMDGMQPPYGVQLTKHMTLTKPECAIVSRFYPGTEAAHIQDGLKGMVSIRRALDMPNTVLRSAVVKTMSLGSATFRDMVAGPEPDPVCREWNQPLLERYQQAGKVFPDMLQQLGAHITYNAPLGNLFEPIFG